MARRKQRAAAGETLGFGFDPAQSPHHFAVEAGRGGAVTLVERFAWGEPAEGIEPSGSGQGEEAVPPPSPKAVLDDYRWTRIAPAAAEAFNARLRAAGLAPGAWEAITPLAPHLGKELTLLAWAVEDADPTLIPMMVANWTGLAPEERWWLYTTVNATSGHPAHGRDRGWRKAIKIAFAENPVLPVAPSALLATPTGGTGRRPARHRGKTLPPTPESEQMTLF